MISTRLEQWKEAIRQEYDYVWAMGDCPNVETAVTENQKFWKTVERKNGWLCQKNTVSGYARIVSPDGIRKGNGRLSVMKEKMERLASKEFIRRGDILGVSRNGLYEHYAIYLGNGRVVHYSGENDDFNGKITIHEAPLSEFVKDAKEYFVVWFDRGHPVRIQCSTSFVFSLNLDIRRAMHQGKYQVFSAEETVRRARSRMGEAKYNLVTNNCEHFAMWCKTGEAVSGQVEQVLNAGKKRQIMPVAYDFWSKTI